jgi:hypothetical protein
MIDLGFQGRFSVGLGADLSFYLPSVSPFHNKVRSSFLFLLMVSWGGLS